MKPEKDIPPIMPKMKWRAILLWMPVMFLCASIVALAIDFQDPITGNRFRKPIYSWLIYICVIFLFTFIFNGLVIGWRHSQGRSIVNSPYQLPLMAALTAIFTLLLVQPAIWLKEQPDYIRIIDAILGESPAIADWNADYREFTLSDNIIESNPTRVVLTPKKMPEVDDRLKTLERLRSEMRASMNK